MHPLLVETAASLKLSEATQKSLWKFCLDYQRWHAASRLTSATTLASFISHHLVDSLSALASLRGESVLDLGTGCGLPGLPLAIADHHRHFTLVDRSARKLGFARYVASRLKLENLIVRQLTATAIPTTFDTVIVRALAPPPEALALAAPLLAPGGRLILMQNADRPPPPDWPAPEIVQSPAAPPAETAGRCLWLYDEPCTPVATDSMNPTPTHNQLR